MITEYLSKDERDKIKDEDFAGPHRSFPIDSQAHVDAAAKLISHAENPAAVKAKIIAIAKRKGFSLPKAWHEEKESMKEAFNPAARVARIKSYFLEDGATSLNGRRYPKEAVDKLILSAQKRLSDPSGLPLTCYLSHDEADKDATKSLVGAIRDVQREGTKAYAIIDIPDTAAGRDVAALVKGNFMKSQSLRASGAQMRMDQHDPLPYVSGDNLSLEGIDFTSSPGLSTVARIADVTESIDKGPRDINEVFVTKSTLVEESQMTKEEFIKPLTSGDSPHMTSDNPADDRPPYYNMPPNSTGMAPPGLQDAHDRVAYVVGKSCAPDTMEAIKRWGASIVKEAGATISGKNKQHLMKAHDGVAKHLGLECSSDGMHDGDDDDGTQSDKKENNRMNQDEALKLLKEAGYSVAPPKTQDEIFQEKLEAMQKAFEQKIEESMKAIKPARPAYGRQSLVEGATATETVKRQYYRNGDYLREQLRDENVRLGLLDRSRPWPENLNPQHVLNELQVELLGIYDARFGLDGQ